MRFTTMHDEAEVFDFLEVAAEYFRKNPEIVSYTKADIEPGELFAVNWSPDDSILVIRLDPGFEPIKFSEMKIRKEEE